jgi:hypothetical protein
MFVPRRSARLLCRLGLRRQLPYQVGQVLNDKAHVVADRVEVGRLNKAPDDLQVFRLGFCPRRRWRAWISGCAKRGPPVGF